MAKRLRKNVWTLKPLAPDDEWDPTLEWYARAVREMRARELTVPSSWRYQAAIHEYDRDSDPLRVEGEALPLSGEQKKFWNQCQHFSWFFLPWHRMYLAYFEQIVEKTIQDLHGPSGWALPYWNYSDAKNPNAGKLPLAFTLPTMKDESDNPLRIEERRGNDNSFVVSKNAADVAQCLKAPTFQATAIGGLAGFGGPVTGFNHDAGAAMGRIDATPHGSVHMAVGGLPGLFMGGFNTAALDPIFWLHHANIDRLWVVWRTRDAAHLDPVSAKWLTSLSFAFHDASGTVVSRTASEVIDPTSAFLDYSYDDTSDPLSGSALAAPAVVGSPAMASEEPEMVGASEAPLLVSGNRGTTTVRLNPPTGPAALRAAASPPDVHLTIENVTGADARGNYAVYVNLPPAAKPEEHPERYAGLVPMFGVPEATRRQRDHPGDGLTFSLDITDVVRRLESRGEWTGSVAVTLVRDDPSPPTAAAVTEEPIRIGRVGVYLA